MTEVLHAILIIKGEHMKTFAIPTFLLLLSFNSFASDLPEKYCGILVKVENTEFDGSSKNFLLTFEDGAKIPMRKNYIRLNTLSTVIATKNITLCLTKHRSDRNGLYDISSIETGGL